MNTAAWLPGLIASALLAAAATPATHQQTGDVALCHISSVGARILNVAAPALGAHLEHGDYVTTLHVATAPGGAGDGVYFERIGSALAAARAGRLARGETVSAACRITIEVPAGEYLGTAGAPASGRIEHFPLVVDVPDITLRGALKMEIDGSGRATGTGIGPGETTLAPLDPLPIVAEVSTPLVLVNGHTGGSAGNGFVLEGLVLRSGHDPAVDAGGQGLLALRVTGIEVRGNRFDAGFTESIDLRSASGDVMQNYLSGTAGTCDICLAGPGNYRAVGNRLLAGGIPGITVDGVVGLPVPSGIEPLAIPDAAETVAEIVNNEVRDHRRTPVGVGIRIDALGVGAPNVRNKVVATVRDNVLINNRFGMIIHAAFPVRDTALKGDVEVAMSGNVFDQTCQARLLVSFSRHTRTLGITANPYLVNSTFRIDLGGNIDWNDVWYGHPDGFGNSLIVDGQPIPNGTRHFYDAPNCPSR